jgi:hypothetical protein
MRVPASEEQLFLLRGLGIFLPHMPSTARTFTHARAADAALASALAGGAAAPGGAPAAPLPARAAALADARRLWAAGLQPKHAWMGVGPGGELLLDLLSGCYIWLTPAPCSGGGGGEVGGGGAEEGGSEEGAEGGARRRQRRRGAATGDARAAETAAVASGAPPDPGAWPPLDADAPYQLTLELPDGSHVPLTPGALAGAAALFAPLTPDRARGGGSDGDDGAAAAAAARAPRRGAAPAPLHRALARAEAAADRLARQGLAFLSPRHVTRLVSAVGGWKVAEVQEGFGHYLSPAGACAARGWVAWAGAGGSGLQRWQRQAGAQSGAAQRPEPSPTPSRGATHMARPLPPLPPPPGARQLDTLRSAGLPASRRYSALDAHRELLRASKARRAPEAPATPAQRARIEELGLRLPRPPGGGGGGEGASGDEGDAGVGVASWPRLTYAQARALLYRAALAKEAAAAAARGDSPRRARGGGGGAAGRAAASAPGAPPRRRGTVEGLRRAAARYGVRHGVA